MLKHSQRTVDRRTLLRGSAAAAGVVGVSAAAGLAAASPASAVVPTGYTYHPLDPYRSYDSRLDTWGKFTYGDVGILQVTSDIQGNEIVPSTTATAVTFNLTITQTGTPGYLGVIPGGSTTYSGSNINWTTPNLDLANGGTTRIAFDSEAGLNGCIKVFCAGFQDCSTHFIIDVTGYYA